MYLSIKEVKTQKDYTLLLRYENGELRQFDMKPYLDLGIFQELKDPTMFNTVKPSFDSIEWANEADLDPEILYKNSTRINH
ncbi:MAG: DUF2442 domain-containing protein [Bacteroidota bacterium]